MAMSKVIEYSDNYSQIYGSLWQHYKDKRNVNMILNPLNLKQKNQEALLVLLICWKSFTIIVKSISF